MTARRIVAGIDSSTQSTKVIRVDADTGEILSSTSAPHPDGTAVAPEHWWSALSSQDDLSGVHAVSVISALGRLDVGQAAVIARGYVLAVEAAEGTDEMLERAGRLRQWGEGRRRGVLVKMRKPGQELRVDLPTIGPRTVELAAKAGLAGLAIEAGLVLIAERDETVARAEREGLFLVSAEGPPA